MMSRRRPCVEATTCPTAAQSAAVVVSVYTGDAVSKILAASWNREAICVARRIKKSASLLTAFTVFGVAPGDPIIPLRKVVSHCDRASNRERLLTWADHGISGGGLLGF